MRLPLSHAPCRAGLATMEAALALGALILLFVALPGAARAARAQAPSNTSLPTITGTAMQGQTLTAAAGAWSGLEPITFGYQWQRCNAAGGSCTHIPGAAGSTYVAGAADVGKTIRVQVTATNADGSAAALSAPTGVVASSAPANTAEPAISGTPQEGQTLSATSGAWTGASPITYAYQWVRCPQSGGNADGSDCASISGATSSKYVLTSADVGFRLRVRVTATNSAGSSTVASNATPTVTARPLEAPRNTRLPTISGSAVEGSRLRASPGTWTGTAPIGFAYAWLRCNTAGGACRDVIGAVAIDYLLRSTDVGATMRVRVTGTNTAGSAAATSVQTGIVQRLAAPQPPGSQPTGVITLPNGERSITAASVPKGERLIVSEVAFSPSPVTSRLQAITVRIKVTDTRGYVVRGALVFIRSTPKVTSVGDGRMTETDGWVTYELMPEIDFPIRDGYSVQFFVKAYRKGDPVLAGISGARLVQVRTARP